jgi:hypothetical protein
MDSHRFVVDGDGGFLSQQSGTDQHRHAGHIRNSAYPGRRTGRDIINSLGKHRGLTARLTAQTLSLVATKPTPNSAYEPMVFASLSISIVAIAPDQRPSVSDISLSFGASTFVSASPN